MRTSYTTWSTTQHLEHIRKQQTVVRNVIIEGAPRENKIAGKGQITSERYTSGRHATLGCGRPREQPKGTSDLVTSSFRGSRTGDVRRRHFR